MARGKPDNLIGRVFDRLTVEARVLRDQWRNAMWRCRCTCGEYTEVRAHHLKARQIRSCGCLLREIARERCSNGGARELAYRKWEKWRIRKGTAA